MTSAWRDKIDMLILRLHDQMPADADLKTRRKVLRENAWLGHEGTSWGKKVWSKAVREYLERFGLPRRQPRTDLPLLSPLEKARRKGVDRMVRLHHMQRGR